jgi:hypothetical protein
MVMVMVMALALASTNHNESTFQLLQGGARIAVALESLSTSALVVVVQEKKTKATQDSSLMKQQVPAETLENPKVKPHAIVAACAGLYAHLAKEQADMH